MTAAGTTGGVPVRALLLCVALIAAGCSIKAPEYELVQIQGQCVKLPLSAVDDGEVHHFTYRYDGRSIDFFIRTDGKGKLHAHFDACYSCFKYKLGYVREGDKMVCIACRLGYDLANEVWDYIGACAPINLRSRVVGQELVIDRKALEHGRKYF